MLLGIDIGTSTIKVGGYAHDGALLAHATAASPKGISDGFENYLPDALWATAARLIREVAERGGEAVEAVAVSSMGEAGLPLDEHGEPTYPIIPWNDPRAERHMAGLAARLPDARWYAITGLLPNPIHSVAKWRWLKEDQPEVWAKSRGWLSAMGFVRYRLTGERVMEASQAARTMAYDVGRNAWSEEILELADIPEGFLPPLVAATDRVGSVTREAAALTGLSVGTPVFAGGHDHICASLACGALTSDIALDSLGTAEGLTFGVAERPDPARGAGFAVGPHVIKGHSYYLGGIYSSGGSVAWVKNLLGFDSFETLLERAAGVPPGASPLFLAHFYGEAPPFNDAAAKGAFLEVTPEHGPEHFARAVLEGIVFEVRRHIEAFERLQGRAARIVRVIGNPAQNRLWLGMRASILGRPLELSRHPDMVTLGCALVAGLGAGVYATPQAAIDATFRVGEIYAPTADSQARYAEVYECYKRTAEALHALREETRAQAEPT